MRDVCHREVCSGDHNTVLHLAQVDLVVAWVQEDNDLELVFCNWPILSRENLSIGCIVDRDRDVGSILAIWAFAFDTLVGDPNEENSALREMLEW